MGPINNTDAMIVTESRWSRLRSAAALRRSRIVIAALILFFASAALVLQPDWHVATSGLHVPKLRHPKTKSSPATPVSQTPLPDESDTEGDGQHVAVLSPDEDGVLLAVANPVFTSPNGRYALALQPDGDLVMSYYQVDDGTAHPLWWTGTGDGHSGGRTVTIEKHKGHVRLVVHAMLENTWVTVWHSDLEPACKYPPPGGHEVRDVALRKETASGHLELSNDGRLTLAGVCDLRVPPNQREKNRSLAVIVAGLYRTNHITCKTHMEHLISEHPSFSRIDVFAYMLYEQADIEVHQRTPESIEADLRECYGPHLKSVHVTPVAEAEEEYPGGKEAMLVPCADRLRRLNNQLRTISLAAQKWWAWTVTNGFTHDTVMRLRPDTAFSGRPGFKNLEEMGNALVLPHPKGEHYFYCARMKGSVGVGPSDQIAYGTPASMQHWLFMHDRFAQMVDLASNPDRPAMRDFSGCEEMPSGPLASDCSEPAPCSIECLVAWYLDARGVDFMIEWGWKQVPLRWKDIGMLGAEEERMADQHQKDKDDGMRWG